MSYFRKSQRFKPCFLLFCLSHTHLREKATSTMSTREEDKWKAARKEALETFRAKSKQEQDKEWEEAQETFRLLQEYAKRMLGLKIFTAVEQKQKVNKM